MSTVCIENVSKDRPSQDELREAVSRLLEPLRGALEKARGGTVILKANLTFIMGPETGSTVDPALGVCIVDWLLEQCGAREVVIAEADATHLSADLAFRILGWEDAFRDNPRVRLLNLTKDEWVKVPVEGRHFREIEMSKTYMEAAALVSFAKLKTHTLEKITCAMKNLYGAYPVKVKIVLHPHLEDVIPELVAARRPDLSIIDGLVAMEGLGPVDGVPRRLGLLVAGDDPVATDHFCARLMGFRPRSVPHLRRARAMGLGTFDYDVRGTPPSPLNLRFRFLPLWKQVLKAPVNLFRALRAPSGETQDDE